MNETDSVTMMSSKNKIPRVFASPVVKVKSITLTESAKTKTSVQFY